MLQHIHQCARQIKSQTDVWWKVTSDWLQTLLKANYIWDFILANKKVPRLFIGFYQSHPSKLYGTAVPVSLDD